MATALMRPLGPAGIALGASIGGVVNLVVQLRLLGHRVGPIVSPADWRALGGATLAALAGAFAGGRAASIGAMEGLGPIPLGVLALGIFGGTYLALTIVLRHPDAERLWKFLRRSNES
jgi:peptidoglycan biosynthesis protein MviN/MurJ (putative lipid II flippase)